MSNEEAQFRELQYKLNALLEKYEHLSISLLPAPDIVCPKIATRENDTSGIIDKLHQLEGLLPQPGEYTDMLQGNSNLEEMKELAEFNDWNYWKAPLHVIDEEIKFYLGTGKAQDYESLKMKLSLLESIFIKMDAVKSVISVPVSRRPTTIKSSEIASPQCQELLAIPEGQQLAKDPQNSEALNIFNMNINIKSDEHDTKPPTPLISETPQTAIADIRGQSIPLEIKYEPKEPPRQYVVDLNNHWVSPQVYVIEMERRRLNALHDLALMRHGIDPSSTSPIPLQESKMDLLINNLSNKNLPLIKSRVVAQRPNLPASPISTANNVARVDGHHDKKKPLTIKLNEDSSKRPQRPVAEPNPATPLTKLTDSTQTLLEGQDSPTVDIETKDTIKNLLSIESPTFKNAKEQLTERLRYGPPEGEIIAQTSKSTGQWTQIFRAFNLIRALVVAAFSINSDSKRLHDPTFMTLGASNLLIASITFVSFDVILSFQKALPQYLWCFWDVHTFDPYQRRWGIWSLIADHEFLIDALPLLFNIILKIFVYRAVEVVANPLVQNTLLKDIPSTMGAGSFSPSNQALICMWLYGASLCMMVLFHAIRLVVGIKYTPTTNQRSLSFPLILRILVAIKFVLTIFDLCCNSMLLYLYLVSLGIQFLAINQLGPVLSVISVSPLITLTTNVFLNLPLHYSFLAFKSRQLLDKDGKAAFGHDKRVPIKLVLRKAMYNSCHPILMIVFGVYSVYACIAYTALLRNVVHSGNWIENPSGTWDNLSRVQVVVQVAIANVVVNYGAGLIGMVMGVLWLGIECGRRLL